MKAELTLEDAIAHLKAKSARLCDKEAAHAEQERFHRAERERHAAELAATTRQLEALQASAAAAAEIWAADPAAGLPAFERLPVAAAVARVTATKPPRATFGAHAVTAEVNHFFANRLHLPATHRLVSVALRRLFAAGLLERVRRGNPHAEAMYMRKEGAEPA